MEDFDFVDGFLVCVFWTAATILPVLAIGGVAEMVARRMRKEKNND